MTTHDAQSQSKGRATPRAEANSVKGSCMNLGGGQFDFKTSGKQQKEYRKQLPKEIGAMISGRDICGFTELNDFWYKWLVEEFEGDKNLPSFAAGPYSIVHDGADCAIMWNRNRL